MSAVTVAEHAEGNCVTFDKFDSVTFDLLLHNLLLELSHPIASIPVNKPHICICCSWSLHKSHVHICTWSMVFGLIQGGFFLRFI